MVDSSPLKRAEPTEAKSTEAKSTAAEPATAETTTAVSDGAAADAPAPAEEASSDPGESANRLPSFAKLLEEEQRVESRARWAVGSSRRRCVECEAEIAPQATFYSLLRPTQLPPDDGRMANVSQLFERVDVCQACWEEAGAERAFAFWKSVMDAPVRAPQKTVNLAALLAYFQHLGGGGPAEGADSEGVDSEGEGLEPVMPVVLGPPVSGEEGERLRYLLGLFLLRKRVLRWIRLDEPVLTVEEAKSKVRHDVIVPDLGPKERDEALAVFEELFS